MSDLAVKNRAADLEVRGYEEHLGVGVEHYLLNLVLALQCGVAAVDGVGSCSQAPSHLDLHRDAGAAKSLGISVADHKTAPFDALVIHIVHSVAATAAHAYNLDDLVAGHPIIGGDGVNQVLLNYCLICHI